MGFDGGFVVVLWWYPLVMTDIAKSTISMAMVNPRVVFFEQNPLKNNMSSSVGMMKFLYYIYIYGKMKNVPNHQSVHYFEWQNGTKKHFWNDFWRCHGRKNTGESMRYGHPTIPRKLGNSFTLVLMTAYIIFIRYSYDIHTACPYLNENSLANPQDLQNVATAIEVFPHQ